MPDFIDITELDPDKNYYIRYPDNLSDVDIEYLSQRYRDAWEILRKSTGGRGILIVGPAYILESDEESN